MTSSPDEKVRAAAAALTGQVLDPPSLAKPNLVFNHVYYALYIKSKILRRRRYCKLGVKVSTHRFLRLVNGNPLSGCLPQLLSMLSNLSPLILIMYTTILFDKLMEHFGIIFMSVLYPSNVGHRSDPCGTAVGAFPSSPYLPRTLKPAESRHRKIDLKKVINSLLLTHSCQSCVRDGECFKLSGDTKPV